MTAESILNKLLENALNLKNECQGDHKGDNTKCDYCKITKHNKLGEELQKHLKISDEESDSKPSKFLTGSYSRGTMNRPPKDVDFFIVLDKTDYTDADLDKLIEPDKLLELLADVLKNKVDLGEKVKVHKQRHSVTVIYDEEFSIDVIPAFESDTEGYLIPYVDGNKNFYLGSNPKVHKEYILKIVDTLEEAGKANPRQVIKIVKYIKQLYFNELPLKLRSFHVEITSAQILEKYATDSLATSVEVVLKNMIAELKNPIGLQDPANMDNLVNDYFMEMDSKQQNKIVERLEEIYAFISAANNATDGKDVAANLIKAFPILSEILRKSAGESLSNLLKTDKMSSRTNTSISVGDTDGRKLQSHSPWKTRA